MQMTFEFFQPAVESKADEPANTGLTVKESLESYIKVCGLVAYKDFYMKIKNGFTAIPAGLTKDQYLMLAREVYESRSAKVNRTKSRSQFFATRNKIKNSSNNQFNNGKA